MRNELAELYDNARDYASRQALKGKVSREEAEEFGAWYAIHILEGRGKHQPIGLAFTDFLRAEWGDNRIQRGKSALTQALWARTPPNAGETPEERLDLEAYRAGAASTPDPEAVLLEQESRSRSLRPLDRRLQCQRRNAVFRMMLEETPQVEIARRLGVSQNRVWQLVREVKDELQGITKPLRGYARRYRARRQAKARA